MQLRVVYVAAALGLAVACGGNMAPDDGEEVESLRVEPAQVDLLVRDGAPVQQSFRLIAVYTDGSELDVTEDAVFTIDDPVIGIVDADTLTVSGVKAGVATITGTVEDGAADAQVTVRVEQSRTADGAPVDAADLFAGGTVDAAADPSIVYPETQTVMPPNIGDFEVHWQAGAGTVLAYELSLRSEYLDVIVYLPPDIDWSAFLPEEWARAGRSLAGQSVTAQLRSVTDDGRIGTASVEVLLTLDDIQGGIYYWAAENDGGNAPGGIYRHDVARPGQDPEAFYTTDQTPSGMCVGCHSLSRDGTRMAVRYEGGQTNLGAVVDVASGDEILPSDGTYQWNFTAFEPDGERFIYAVNGGLTMVDVASEMTTPITGPDTTTQPDFSPDGSKLLYVRYASGDPIWFTGGSIVTRPFDAGAGTFGDETVLVPAEGMNVYYPSWSPDGEWVLFNKSTGDAYDDADAELWIVKADGTVPPMRLDVPTAAGDLTDSWARWAPFAQRYPMAGGGEEPLFWFTWSSKRAFGVRLPEGKPQLWMAPFFPMRAEAGEEASAPAFRLPFQDIASNNHIAQWTERIVAVE